MGGPSNYQPIQHSQAYPYHRQQRSPMSTKQPYWHEEEEIENEEELEEEEEDDDDDDEEPDEEANIGYLDERRLVRMHQ